jgi:hypothetical protein
VIGMAKTQIEFYAVAEEQRAWLETQCQPGTWIRYWEPSRPVQHEVLTPQSVRLLDFEAKHGDDWMLFLGRKDMAPESVWLDTAVGRQIDFVKSMAIQFVPSLAYHDKVLLEGRISIMRVENYQQEGIDCAPLLNWFNALCRSFQRAVAKRDAVVTQRTTEGTIKEWRKVLVSERAVEWRHSGRKVKQFPKGEVEFDIRISKKDATK